MSCLFTGGVKMFDIFLNPDKAMFKVLGIGVADKLNK
jgi:hypothetical protein